MFSAKDVKSKCNGMLPVSVYQEIYDTACACPGICFVEVGTAHAAATVCLARALKDTNRSGKVYSFEKILGGSREQYGDVERNIEIIRGNIDHFGVSDYVELIIGDVRECADRVPSRAEIGLLLLDADGCIDRDFEIFYDRVKSGGAVVIDDVQDRVILTRNGWRGLNFKYRIDQKHRLSHEFLSLFQSKGLIDRGSFCGEATWHGKKLDATMADVTREEILAVYRRLVFADAERSFIPFRPALGRFVRRALPEDVVNTLRDVVRGRKIR